jgi:hypothetical protein
MTGRDYKVQHAAFSAASQALPAIPRFVEQATRMPVRMIANRATNQSIASIPAKWLARRGELVNASDRKTFDYGSLRRTNASR